MSFIIDWFWSLLKTLGLSNKTGNIVFLGLDNAGKTTLMQMLKNQHLKQPAPTFHPTSEELRIEGIDFSAWDLGGHTQARRLWKDYFPVVDAILFIVDASDEDRFEEAKTELQGLLESKEISSVPIAVLGNKIDKQESVNEDTLRMSLGLVSQTTGKGVASLKSVRPIETFMCSIVNRSGYSDAFKWISQYIE